MDADGDDEMLREACNSLNSHLQTNAVQRALLTAQ